VSAVVAPYGVMFCKPYAYEPPILRSTPLKLMGLVLTEPSVTVKFELVNDATPRAVVVALLPLSITVCPLTVAAIPFPPATVNPCVLRLIDP